MGRNHSFVLKNLFTFGKEIKSLHNEYSGKSEVYKRPRMG